MEMNPRDDRYYTEAIFNQMEYSQWDDIQRRMKEYAISHPRFLEIEEDEEEEEFPEQFYMYPLGRGWDKTRQRMSPIQGPPDLFQVWRIGQLGEVVPQQTTVEIEQQLSKLSSELLCNVTFVRFIGSGSFGAVYEVTADLRSSQVGERYGEFGKWEKGLRFACKMLRHTKPGFSAGVLSSGDIEVSLNEMKILRYLRHQNICNIKEIIGIPEPNTGFPYNIICYFYELCDGSFVELIHQKQKETADQSWYLTENLNKPWVSQIMSALEYIHSNDIVHRDIHSENILYNLDPSLPIGATYEDSFRRSTFKLTDFGISEQFELSSSIYSFEAEKNSDIGKLLELLFLTSIPKANDPIWFFNFHNVCKGRKPNHFDPKEWLTVNPVLKNFFASYDFLDLSKSMSAKQFLQHQWLQPDQAGYSGGPVLPQATEPTSSISQTDDSDDSDDGWGSDDFY